MTTTQTPSQQVEIYEENTGIITISVPTDRPVSRYEIVDLVKEQLRDADHGDVTAEDLEICWSDSKNIPDNVDTYPIKEITQEQIADLKQDVEGCIGEGYDLVASGMWEASEAWADRHGFNPGEVNEIIELDNFTIMGDEERIQTTANSIRRWKPEHRAQLLALLTA